jgi:hypothetical protein
MMRLSIFFVLVACGGGSAAEHDPCDRNASGQCPEGLTCTYPMDGGRPVVCNCQSGFFVCNSCPTTYSPPSGACTPGDSCEWNTWEHGCSCGCGSSAVWSCTPETIGTFECGHDAGV